MKVIEGGILAKSRKIAVIQAKFNSLISSTLVQGAVDTLKRHGVAEEDIDLIKVPGAFEIPLVLMKVAQSGRYDGAVCLGAVIRGETPHFDFVAGENAKGIQSVMMEFGFPAAYGVITPNNLEQALERAGVKAGNKGSEAASVLVEMLDLCEQLKS